MWQYSGGGIDHVMMMYNSFWNAANGSLEGKGVVDSGGIILVFITSFA